MTGEAGTKWIPRRKAMKKVTIVIPEKILHVSGTNISSETKEVETTRENITEALEANDYHVNYYFPGGTVKVESVEDV